MNFQWPWRKAKSDERLVFAWTTDSLAYIQGRRAENGSWQILQLGVDTRGTDSDEAWQERLGSLALNGAQVQALLRPEQYQLLQIEAPKVEPEELRHAARYQIREMVDSHLDDLTVDVLYVGDGQSKSGQLLFVVAARNDVVRQLGTLAQTMQWPLNVIDIHELAQRNLQSAIAARSGKFDQATACLVVVSERQAVITIAARGELFFSRRLDLPEGFMDMQWGDGSGVLAPAQDAYTPVGEYVPDYAASPFSTDTAASMGGELDKAQRVVVEVQRSLDLWERTWRDLPLASFHVHAADRTQALADWLSMELGQTVLAIDTTPLCEGLDAQPRATQMACLPLLGLLMRTEDGKER